MISSVDNNIINMVLNNAQTQKSQNTGETQKPSVINAEETALSSAQQTANTDTLELSTQAQSYLDEVNTDELYTYTGSQFKQFLNLGKITQSEYDEEMASRNSGTAAEE